MRECMHGASWALVAIISFAPSGATAAEGETSFPVAGAPDAEPAGPAGPAGPAVALIDGAAGEEGSSAEEDGPLLFGFDAVLLDELEVRAQRGAGSESLEIREVRESFALDVGDAMRDLPAVTAIRKGSIANDVGIRGFFRGDSLLVIDGLRVENACPNRMDPATFHIDFSEVESIEVEKGPFDVRYQGAMGGRVLVRTREIEPGLHGTMHGQFGSFDTLSTSARLSWGEDRFGAAAGGAYRTADPYVDGDGRLMTEIYPETSSNRYRPQERGRDAFRVKTGWVRTEVEPFDDHRLTLSYARQEADRVLYPYLLMDGDRDDTDRAHLRYEIRAISPRWRAARGHAWFAQVGHDMSDTRRASSTADPATGTGELPRLYSMQTGARSTTSGGALETDLCLFGEEAAVSGTTTLGVELLHRGWEATTTRFRRPISTYVAESSMPHVSALGVGVWARHEEELASDVTLTVGARFDHSRTDSGVDRSALWSLYFVDPPRSADDNWPSGFALLDWSFAEDWSTFVGGGHAQRVPDGEERYFALLRGGTAASPDRIGNPSLPTVKNTEVDLGVRYTGEGLFGQAQLFYSDLDDFIVVRDATDGTRIARTYLPKDARMYGAEGSARWVLPAGFSLHGSLMYVRGENCTDSTDLPEIPPLKGTLALRWSGFGYFAEAGGVLAARQGRVDDQLDEPDTDAWARFDLKAGYEFEKLRLRLIAGVRNVLDTQYTEHLSYYRNPFSSGVRMPEPGRTFHISAQLDF